jgi:hypothetical protein
MTRVPFPDERPWMVSPGQPGAPAFVVADADGCVGLDQVSPKNFKVRTAFEFVDEAGRTDLRNCLLRRGEGPSTADAIVEAACRYVPSADEVTDLASIPWFMRWFENTYGRHTLAAIIHDRLILDRPNSGVLGSDTLSDRFFRQMLGAVEVPPLKKWVMWAGIAMRSRWAPGGLRRASLVVWGLLAVAGNAAAVAAVSTAIFGSGRVFGFGWVGTLAVAAAAAVLASALWGRQFGAGLVAAINAIWVLPPALAALIGYAIYWLDEHLLAPPTNVPPPPGTVPEAQLPPDR